MQQPPPPAPNWTVVTPSVPPNSTASFSFLLAIARLLGVAPDTLAARTAARYDQCGRRPLQDAAFALQAQIRDTSNEYQLSVLQQKYSKFSWLTTVPLTAPDPVFQNLLARHHFSGVCSVSATSLACFIGYLAKTIGMSIIVLSTFEQLDNGRLLIMASPVYNAALSQLLKPLSPSSKYVFVQQSSLTEFSGIVYGQNRTFTKNTMPRSLLYRLPAGAFYQSA